MRDRLPCGQKTPPPASSVHMIIDAQLKVLNSGIDSPPRRARLPGSTQRTRLIKNVASIRICQ